MSRSAHMLCVAFALFVLHALCPAQVPTGTPPFGSFGGGPFDVVNLGNLNAHFDINVLTKAGRGTPFTYDITYDTSIWYPTSVNGVQTWQPVAGYGWNIPVGASGSITNQIIYQGQQPCNPPTNMTMINFTIYAYYAYTDTNGLTHPFNTAFQWFQPNSCGLSSPGSTATAADGSGYVLTLASGTGAETVAGSNGIVYIGGPAPGVTDSNGNEITASNGTFTDTLGQTALTISGTYPTHLQYTAPNGSTASWTINYTPYNLQTSFGCSGIAEATVNGVELPQNITLPDGTSYSFTYENTAGHSGYKTGRLASVTLPTGGSITYTYPTTNSGANNGINCTDGSAPVAANANPSLTRTISPGNSIWTYYRTDISGNHWQTKVTSPADPINPGSVGDDTVIDFQQDSSTVQYANTHNFFETQRQAFQGTQSGGNILSTAITCYNTPNPTPANCPTTSVSTLISRVTAFLYLPNTSGRVSEVDTQYNQYSDPAYPSEIDNYDFGTTAGSVGPLIHKVLNSWDTLGSTTNPTIVLGGTTVENGSLTASSVSYTYGQSVIQTSGTPQHTTPLGGIRANLTGIQQQVTGSPTYLYRAFTYYDTGMPSTATDWGTTSSGGANITTYNYNNSGTPSPSCGNSFATNIQEPQNLQQNFTWNCTGGVQLTAKDENGNTSTTDYSSDPYFWRPDSITDPLLNVSSLTYSGQAAAESALIFNNNASVMDARATVDALGRSILTQRAQSPSLTAYDTVETDYDSIGRATRVTMPFQAGPGGTNSSGPATTTTYDALNRPLTVTDGGGGTVSYQYLNNDVLVSGAGGQTFQKQFEYDGLGRLASVCEITGGTSTWPGGTCSQVNSKTGYWTKYAYDVLGDLTGVIQNAQSGTTETRGYSFDMLGRMTQEINPENGTTQYWWDTSAPDCKYGSIGDLSEKKDNAGNIMCYYHDGLHRLQATSGGGVCRILNYDSPSNPLPSGVTPSNTAGRLIEAYTNNCNGGAAYVDDWFGYDADGRASDVWESTPSSGGYYHSTATYWPNSVLHTLGLFNKSSSAVVPTQTFGVDSEGRSSSVSASAGQNPVQSVSYVTSNGTGQPVGALTGVTYGSQDSDAFTYDPNTGRMTQYAYGVGSTPQTETGSMLWNPNGTLSGLAINDPFNSTNSQTCNYGYDDLSRLSGVSCGGETNLLNPGFEAGNVDWALGGGWSIVNNSSNAQSGSWYLSGSATTETPAFAVNSSGNRWSPVTPGSVLNYGGWISRIAGTGTMWYTCEVVDSSSLLSKL